MAIAKMNRFTLLTFQSNKDKLMEDMQRFGDVHFRDITADEGQDLDFLRRGHSPSDISRVESELDRVNFALGKLAPYAEKAGLTAKRPSLSYAEFHSYLSDYDYGSVCAYLKELDDRSAAIQSEISRIRAENDALRAWMEMDVSPTELDGLTVARSLTGTVNKLAADSFKEAVEGEFPFAYIEFFGAVKDDISLLILSEPDTYEELFAKAKDLGFTRAALGFSGIPRAIVSGNNARISELEGEAAGIKVSIKAKAAEQGNLSIARDCLNTILHRERACENFLRSDSVVFIEGWVPTERDSAFRALIVKACGEDYFLEEEAVESGSESVPIKLKNNGFVSVFENITAMYSMPKYNEFDPTPLLAPFYWLFFGLMVGDIGYGLVLMIGTLAMLKLMDLKEGMKKFIKFFFCLSFAVILAGVLYGSLFGFAVITPLPVLDANGVQQLNDAGQPMFKAILDSQLDIPTMLIASVALGVVHVLFGVVVKGVLCLRRGDIAGAIFDSLFWILAVLSGIGMILNMMVPGLLPPAIGQSSSWILYGSLIGLACTQGRSSPSIGGKIGNGLYGVYGISSYVGDLVSYTRIVALALSGAYIAYSFNKMAEILPEGPVRIIFGFVIMLLGQTLNFGLALLGAYVHTCRLQYVEYFGKFYEGGGVLYKPLTLQHDSIHIKN
jgi:V/A-type H+-transporting ATPase subunit I